MVQIGEATGLQVPQLATGLEGRLGLPDLPVVEWPETEDELAPGVHWKTAFLTRWADGRPFVWLDDETTAADREWVAEHHPGPAFLHRVDPYTGLSAPDLEVVHRWLTQPSVGAAFA